MSVCECMCVRSIFMHMACDYAYVCVPHSSVSLQHTDLLKAFFQLLLSHKCVVYYGIELN